MKLMLRVVKKFKYIVTWYNILYYMNYQFVFSLLKQLAFVFSHSTPSVGGRY